MSKKLIRKNNMTIFEKYLENKFLDTYRGSKDDFDKSFDRWVCGLDTNELINHANNCIDLCLVVASKHGKVS